MIRGMLTATGNALTRVIRLFDVRDLLLLTGLGSVTAGLSMVYVPAALIFGGAWLTAAALKRG